MYPKHGKHSSAPWLRALLIFALALPLAACDNDVNLPTPPPWPTPPYGELSVQVTGTMTTAEGDCLEATVRWNGLEIPGGRAACRQPGGCAELELWPLSFERENGRHTIAFQVLRQSRPTQDYRVQGRVAIEAENGSTLFIPLPAKRARLAAGESVTYEIELR